MPLLETKINGENALVYTPEKPASKHAIIFIHGLGEGGSDISKLYKNGPFQFIKNGTFAPDYHVFALQQPSGGWMQPSQVVEFIDYVIAKYPVETFSLTGLSMGARAAFRTVNESTKHLGRIKSVVAMSLDNDILPWKTEPYEKIKLWSLIGNKDISHGLAKLKAFTNSLIAKGYKAKYTEYAGSHDGWSTIYNPNWKDASGQSVYDWMTQDIAPVVVTPPVVEPPKPEPVKTVTKVITITIYSDGTSEVK